MSEVYETKPLEDDLTLSGPLEVHLRVSTSGTDSRLDCQSRWTFIPMNCRPPSRRRWNSVAISNSFAATSSAASSATATRSPKHSSPTQPTVVKFSLPDINHCFRKGHRLMVQVPCSWFPLADINPQKFCDIYHAKPEDFQIATQHVYHGGDNGSSITVQVLPPAEVQ